jgi:colanic acid biosynthesis glycosyl transferase WcaI
MKILLVNQAFHPEVVSSAQHATDLALGLIEGGHQVTVLASKKAYKSLSVKYKSQETYKGIDIIRCGEIRFNNKGFFFRILSACSLLISFAIRLASLLRYDCVIVMTSPPLVSFVASIYARIKKVPLICWIMDLNPDQAIALGWVRRDSLTAAVLEKAKGYALKTAHKIIVLDAYMKRRILGADPSAEGKIEIIPPWSHDQDLLESIFSDNSFRKQHHLEGKFVVMYSGNMSICHPFNTVLDAARLLKDKNVEFVFIGDGERAEDIVKYRKKHKLTNVMLLPYQERKNMKYSLSSADIHIVVMGESFVGIVHPCKIYGILTLGKPFIYVGPPRSHIGDIITRYDVGEVIQHGDHEKFAKKVHCIQKKNRDEINEIALREKLAASQFTMDKLRSKMIRAIEV